MMDDRTDALETLQKLQDRANPFPENNAIKDWKASGKKVFGYVCIYVPEEILYAADILPFRITGDNEELELKKSEAYLYVNTCSFARTAFQLVLDEKLGFLDGLVTGETCDGPRRFFDIMLDYHPLPFMHIYYVPRKWTDRSHNLMEGYFLELKTKLEEHLGREITTEALRHSIEVYNKGRRLIHQVYEFRKQNHPPITGAETLEVVKAAMRMPREEYNQLLEELVKELSQTDRRIKKDVRMMVLGSVLTNSQWLEGLESSEAVVVIDEMCTGTRYFWGQVEPSNPNLIRALSDYCLNRPPCPRFQPSERRFDHISQMIEEYNVHGVISEIVRYCVPHGHDKPLLKMRLDKRDIPVLELDLEYGQGATGQHKTRIEAFLEMLKAKTS